MNKFTALTTDHLKVLRSWQLADHGQYEGINFVRCGRNLENGFRVAREMREATGLDELQLTCANHPDYGDYIRLDTSTDLYAYLCHLKS